MYAPSSMFFPFEAQVVSGPVELQTEDLMEMEDYVGAVNYPVTSIRPPHHFHISSSGPDGSPRGSSSVPGCVSMPSLSHITSAENNKPTRAASLPDMKLQSSFEEFTPDLSDDDEDHEGYRFQCSCPGLYQCSVTGLVFDMEGEGDVVYRTVPWNRRLLVQHHKKPAGPLFDIKCEQQSVRQLHLPHCQILPTAGFLAVAHVKDDGVEFISPHKITETHLVINIRGFSGFGNVKDEDSPPDPVRALVLLFYRPPDDPDVTSILNVLLLPKNVSLRDVQRTRRKLVGEERYIETSPHCKLLPDQVYTLSTAPEDDSVLVQPTEAEFEEDCYDNYFPTFQVFLETTMKHMKLFLRDSSSQSVWDRRVCLSSAGQIKSCGTNAPNKKLLDVRSSFIDGTSGPVLNSLLDKLLEKKVLTDSERESADVMPNRRDKARFIIDTVRKKGDTASSEMIEFLCELDPFLCEHLDLM
ncbi:caspase recruitment domain-containing protein 8-like [Acanthochromis polyacanthus]|uniref:caspase recruitment domain-containing protein 8-like n=1 Tax=Acanthochromis polyacanthus TaxID=80966 RepID=UPI0022347582|nr:caspase recruitment domain-containing protein 8-like [Acanthochromis polyacanthus]